MEDKAVLESQRVGKVAALCEADSAFESYTSACLACLEANGDGTKNNFIVSYISNLSTDARVWCEPVGTGPEIGASSAGSTITPIPISQTQSLARRSQCPTYPSASLSTISSTGSLTSSLSSSSSISTQTSTSSYQFGYWLEYTFTLCPTRTTNAEFAYPTDCLLANYTWGCPPGYLCAPPQVNCDLEVGPPSDSYVCSPENCQSPPALDLDALTITTKANTTIYSPLALPTGYFNLDPVIFGADWGIFTGSVSVTLTSNAASSTPTSAGTSLTHEVGIQVTEPNHTDRSLTTYPSFTNNNKCNCCSCNPTQTIRVDSWASTRSHNWRRSSSPLIILFSAQETLNQSDCS